MDNPNPNLPIEPPPETPLDAPASPVRPTTGLGGLGVLLLFLLAAAGLLVIIQVAAIFLMGKSPAEVQFDPIFLVGTQVFFYTALGGLLYGFVCLGRGLSFTSALALRRVPVNSALKILLGGILLALAVAAFNSFFPPPEKLPFEKLFSTRTNALAVLAASVLIAPLAEELVFRGYIYTLLEGLWGKTPAVFLSGVAFGAIHFPQLSGGYVQMAALTVVGIVFSAVRARTGNTTAAMLMHLGYNATLSVGFLLSPDFQELAFFLF